jgi:hypothetical protein
MIDIDVISSPVFHEINSLLSSLSSPAAADVPFSKKRSEGSTGDSLASLKKRKA